jgi:hypothetical protein
MMMFAASGIGFKSDLMLVEGRIDTNRYIWNLDRLHFIEALVAVQGPSGWIFRHDSAPAQISQRALDSLEESVDVHGWPANSPDLSQIEVLWTILKKLVKRINSQTIEDLKATLVAAWALIPQTLIDRLCQGFESPLELCLIEDGNSILNQLWRISERTAIKEAVWCIRSTVSVQFSSVFNFPQRPAFPSRYDRDRVCLLDRLSEYLDDLSFPDMRDFNEQIVPKSRQ